MEENKQNEMEKDAIGILVILCIVGGGFLGFAITMHYMQDEFEKGVNLGKSSCKYQKELPENNILYNLYGEQIKGIKISNLDYRVKIDCFNITSDEYKFFVEFNDKYKSYKFKELCNKLR